MSAGVLESPKHFGYDPLENFPEEFPYSDGEPLESSWHFWQIALLLELTQSRWEDRYDYYCGGNMFIHYSLERARNKDFRGPDYFLVLDVDRIRERKYWASWDEDGRLPDLIIELLSPSTADTDRGEKFQIYEQTFKTHEYFLYDPETETLEGYRLVNGRYRPIPRDANGHFFSEKLNCAIGFHVWKSKVFERRGLRFFESDGTLIPTTEEKLAAAAEAVEAAEIKAGLMAEQLAAAEARIAQLEQRQ